jgi:hypothetical protein
LGNAINVFFLPYIGGNIDRLTAFAANLVNNLAEGILITGCKDKLPPFLCSHSGGHQANSAGGSGNDNDLVLEGFE